MNEDLFQRGRAQSPLVQVTGVTHMLLARQKPADMKEFLSNFGLREQRASDSGGSLSYRGTGTGNEVLRVRPGNESRFMGIGLRVPCVDDLEVLTRVVGASGVEETYGDQHQVRLRSPAGVEVYATHGGATRDRLQTRAHLPTNRVGHRTRFNSPQRVHKGPAQVERLAHVGIQVRDVVRETGWFMQTFGLLASELVTLQSTPRGGPIGSYLRCDLGRDPADHHILSFFLGPRTRLLYGGFEVLDFDDIATGGEHLYRCGARHVWGPGRHVLGSNIFDYWRGPAGDVFGHVSDVDLFDAEIVPRRIPLSRDALQQWGRPLPENFFDVQRGGRRLTNLAGRLAGEQQAHLMLAMAGALR